MGVRQQDDRSQMHRRKLSTEEDENIVVITNDDLPELQSNGVKGMSSLPPSAGPYRTSFSAASNGQPPSPFRSSFSHTRSHTRAGSSVSTQSLLSPMSAAFPTNYSHSNGSAEHFPTSNPADLSHGTPTKHNHRHSRLHSRNLSIFFPRPGSLPEHSIAEDGTQELELGITDEEAPISDIPPAESPGASEHRKKLKGFTFGGRPSEEGFAPMPTGRARRGHHHKHSLSHNFFSFLEPGSQSDASELHTAATPIPVSPWNPVSPFPDSAWPTKTGFSQNGHVHHGHEHEHGHQHASPAVLHSSSAVTRFSPIALAATMGQFLLGAWLWVSGQQIGSLACTGLGYWVVFDSFGIALNAVLPVYLAKSSMQSKIRRPYGNARIETVAMFAQSVYLMFSSVYVCKETVEHLLLSTGEGHHHHQGDEEPNTLGIEFPVFLVFVTLMSLIITALRFNNHTKLVNTAGNHIPPISSVIRDTFSRYPTSPSVNYGFRPSSPTEAIMSNPFILLPILFCISILFAATFMPLAHYRIFDLVLAAVETVVTFNVAYRASVVLGTVLLQTSPERGLSGGRMEAFLRAMKEVERHPKILHLPAPHIWQLTPSLANAQSPGTTNKGLTESLVVTMELHVPKDLGDDDVLELTRWAWERCVSALHLGTGKGGPDGERSEAEVTVGVVRG